MSEHTRGPWFADGYKVWAGEERGYKVADTAYHADPGFDEQRANARLIAAAPELLEAAKYALSVFEAASGTTTFAHQRLAAAIAKAEGSS